LSRLSRVPPITSQLRPWVIWLGFEASEEAFVLFDLPDKGCPVSTGYKVRRSPTFIFVDRKGVVEGIWEGEESLDRLIEEVRLKLAGGK